MDTASITAYSRYQHIRGFSRRTIERRRWTLTKLAAHLGHTDPTRISADDIEDFLANYPSPSSRYALRSDIAQYCAWLIRRGDLHVNPADRVVPAKIPRRDATPLAADDLARAINLADGRLHRALILGADAGLRISEIAALHRRDIHLDKRILVIRSGKGGSDGVLPMSNRLHHTLTTWASGTTDPRPVGGTGDAVGNMIRRHFRRLGIEARPHDLRHSFGTAVAAKADGNLLAVADLMRHASAITSQRYVRWTPSGAHLVHDLHDTAA